MRVSTTLRSLVLGAAFLTACGPVVSGSGVGGGSSGGGGGTASSTGVTLCDAHACDGMPASAIALLCPDGSSPAQVCGETVWGSCGWVFPECPGTCATTACGPQLGMPNSMCADGSMAGPTGQCLAHADGTCGWEIRSCPVTDIDAGSPATCKSDMDCGTGMMCGFTIADGCSAVGTCVVGPGSGTAMCEAYAVACSCSGTEVSVICNGYPAGQASAPIAHSGTCP